MADWLAGVGLTGVIGTLKSVISFVILFGTLVFIHELGHFLVAKWSGVRVHEFALGFGPALLSKRFGETLYALRIVPLGGFVKLAGMEPTEDLRDDNVSAIEDDERAFHRRPVSHRLGILVAGPLMNLLLAAVLFAVIISGLVVTVGNVVPGSPAERGGLQSGDRFVAVNKVRIVTVQQVLEQVQRSEGRPVNITVDRNGRRETIVVEPQRDAATGIPLIGIELRMDTGATRRPIGESVAAGFQQAWTSTITYVRDLGRMASGQQEAQLAGPIGIFQMTGESAEGGILSLLSFAAMLSVAVGVFNLLPIPILDGGGIVFVILEGLRGRPLNPEHKGIAQIVGLSLLLLLLIFATWQDLGRLFFGQQL